jgi:hypothetical protein
LIGEPNAGRFADQRDFGAPLEPAAVAALAGKANHASEDFDLLPRFTGFDL